MTAHPARVTKLLTHVVATGLVAGTFALLGSAPASAATGLTVSTTSDVASTFGACGDSSVTTPRSPLSLREAVCLANNLKGTTTITVPSGRYTLTSGELKVGTSAGQDVTVSGAGSASTIIDGGGSSRVLNLDPDIVGDVDVTLRGLTITGGATTSVGGAGILGGSGSSTSADSLTIADSVVTGNTANASAQSRVNNPGGGVQFYGGSLTITGSTISGNSSYSSPGSGVAYYAQGAVSGESLSITGTTFSGNASTSSGAFGTVNSGALDIGGTATTALAIADSRFVGNTLTATSAGGAGGAIRQTGGVLSVTGSTFTGNSVTGNAVAQGGALEVASGTSTLRYNRITGNTASSGSGVHVTSGTVDAKLNWLGCNGGSGSSGCDTIVSAGAAVEQLPRLALTGSASPATVVGPNGTTTPTVSLLTDSLGGDVPASKLTAFSGLPVTWSSPLPSAATLSANSSTVSGGTASVTYDSKTSSGAGSVKGTFDAATVVMPVTVNQRVAITQDPSDASVAAGAQASFTVQASGYPAPTYQWQRSTDGGASFANIAGATSSTYSFTASGDDNDHRFRVIASNGLNPSATSAAATLTVDGPSTFTSSDAVTFTEGVAKTFTVTTSGFPEATSVTKTGTLPPGLGFADNGDGTATLAGTPSAGSAGVYPVTLTAVNGRSPSGTQNLTITVAAAPKVTTSPTDATVKPGDEVSFSAAASGTPAPTVQWQRSTDDGDSWSNVAGATSTVYTFTAARGDDENRYRAVFTNGSGSATSGAATLRVGTAPAFTSAAKTTFSVGAASSFDLATSGAPDATLSATGSLPTWLSLADDGDGTGTLTGTPPAGSGGTYTFTLKAANGFSPSASQSFTLTVNERSSITSADSATFTTGTAGSFTVTTSPGFPSARTLVKTGALPAGISFTDEGDGTATLAGIPQAGSGGVYPVTLKVTNAAGDATQSFTLTVREPVSITSADSATFAAGTDGSFTVTTGGGYPSATSLTAGTLPDGLTFTDNGDGTATVSGTPSADDAGTSTVVVTASNGVAPAAKQTLTLTITSKPIVTSADTAQLTIGTAGSIDVTASGFPVPELTVTGNLPSGVTASDDVDGSVTLSGTPAAGTAGTYTLAVKATSSTGTATQTLTVTVKKADQAITVTSVDPTAPVVGDSYTPTAVADSGDDVVVSIGSGTTGSACSLTDGAVSFDAAGTCVIAFDQPGNASYSAAPRVTRTITVSKVASTVDVTTSVSPSVYGQVTRATATVTHAGGATVAGTVQFSVDGVDLGAPVVVTSGTAESPELRAADGDRLAPGSYAVDARFVPTNEVKYASATGTTTQVVGQAATTTSVTVKPASIVAEVVPTAPGSGTPTGTVTFSVGGDELGTARLVDGVATLQQSVPTGLARQVSAVYGGDTAFTGSSTSVTRNDPTITASVSSTRAKTSYGWYGAPVTVTFTCTTNGAALTEPCPAPVRLGRGAGQSVTRTIASTDGGVATAVVSGINVDDQRPTLKIRGVKSGGVYGVTAPKATCSAKDALSGVASCKVTKRKRGTTTTVTATATDKAGNTRSRSVRYRTSVVTLEGARFRNGAYDVVRGRTYTLVVQAGSRPRYYQAEVAPRTPRKFGGVMRSAGKGRYALGVTMKDLRGRTYWNLGVKIKGKMHVVRVRAKG